MVERYDEQLFLEYVEGELTHEKRLAFENQMLQDPRLRNLVAQMVIDRHRLRTMADEQPPAHLMDVVHERLERSMLLGDRPAPAPQGHVGTRSTLRWRRIGTLAAMAAMFALVASVFLTTLVSLSRETPMSDMGSGTLLPPGIRPSQPLTTTIVPRPQADTPETPDLMDVPSAPDAQAEVNLPADAQAATESATQPTAAELAAVPLTPEPLDDLTAAASADDLPAVDLVMQLTTTNLPITERRLTGWAEAYQALILDTRQMPASIAPQPHHSANQPLRLTPPAPQQAQAITLRLPESMISHLRTFLGSVSGVSLEEWATTATEPSQTKSDTFKGLESLFPSGSSPLDWLAIPTPGSRSWEAQDHTLMPPLRPEPVGDSTGVVEVRVELIAVQR